MVRDRTGAGRSKPRVDVTTASSVIEALQHIASESFDVLLSDLHMPDDGDGLIVVGAMRHANPKAVTLLLSANPDMTKATASMLRQVDNIVTKPVKAGAILQAIRSIWRRRSRRGAAEASSWRRRCWNGRAHR